MGLYFNKVPPEKRRIVTIEEGKIMAKEPDTNERKAVIPAPTAVGAAVARGEGDLVELAHPGTPAWAEVVKGKEADMLLVEVLPGMDFLDHNQRMRRGTRPDAQPDQFYAPSHIAHQFAANKLVKIISEAPEGTLGGNAAVAAPSTKEEATTGAIVAPETPPSAAAESKEAVREPAESTTPAARTRKR